MKRSDFGEVFKGEWVISGVKGLLITTGIHIPS
jgi:hypothetical protein